MKTPIFVFSVILACIFTSCNSDFTGYKITVGNPNDLKRNAQTIEIALNQLTGLTSENFDQLSVKDNQGNILLSQLIDSNGDSISDYIIFQSDFEAQETLSFYITINSDVVLMNQGLKRTYCRFVPERMDDFAWENDKVAFRTYGPACQKLFEDGKPGGLISSGIDCWLKRVDYPIIDKWYKKNEAGGSYHVDDREALDNSYLGTAIIVNNKEVESMMDSENNWLNVALNDKSFNYWAGYGWKKAGQFSTSEDWEKFVNNQSTIKHTPLKIKIE